MAIHGRFFPFLCSLYFSTDRKDHTLNIKIEYLVRCCCCCRLEEEKREGNIVHIPLRRLSATFLVRIIITSTSWPPRKLMFARHTHHNGVCTSHIHQSVTKCEIPSFIYIRESASYRVLVIVSFSKYMPLCSRSWSIWDVNFTIFCTNSKALTGNNT